MQKSQASKGSSSKKLTLNLTQIASISCGKLGLRASPLLIYIALALLVALVFGLIAQGYRTSGDHASAPPVSLADPTIPSAPMR